MKTLLVNKLLGIYGIALYVSEGVCEIYEVKSSRGCVCYANNHEIPMGTTVNRIVVPAKKNGGVTICKECFEKLLDEKFFAKTLVPHHEKEESKNTGFNQITILTDNLADVCYLKLYGFGAFGKDGDKIRMIKGAVNAEETMRNAKPFYKKENVTVMVNGKIAHDYEEARAFANMKIREELTEEG